MRTSGYWLLLVTGIFGAFYLWKIASTSGWSSSMRAKALIHFDLSIPPSSSSSSSSILPSHRPVFESARRRWHRSTLSRYMLQLYHRRPDTDIIRALQPVHVSGPLGDGGRILEFTIPLVNSGQSLETAELLGIAGAIVRVRSFHDAATRNGDAPEILRSRKEDTWRAFNVTSAIAGRSNGTVKLYVHGRLTYRPYGDGPILLLNYNKTDRTRRQRRSVRTKRDQENERRTKGNAGRRRRRDTCRRRSLYVDFASISYDRWVVAPAGYEAYQCTGKCVLPFPDHLNPTQHAIVQTLMHGALQHLQSNDNLDGSKIVGRACCVPTRLAPTSLLYLDNRNSLTYEYDYEDMVVVECGCR